MPATCDYASLNSSLIEWCDKYYPRALQCKQEEWRRALVSILGADLYRAAKFFEQWCSYQCDCGNEDLLRALGGNIDIVIKRDPE